MKFKINDIIVSNQGVERRILKSYKTFYKWKYLNSEEVFDTRNSNDPLLDYWQIKLPLTTT